MKFQEDFELREKVFRKMGWEQNSTPTHTSFWWEDDDLNRLDELPPIERSWEVCAEYLVPFMREMGFDYRILNYPDILGLGFFWVGQVELAQDRQWVKSPITNNNISRAACEAFLEVEL